MNGVTVYDRDRAWPGCTLFCESLLDLRQAREPKGFIYLIDMEGEPVHVWTAATTVQSYARLLPDGNLIYPTVDRGEISHGTCGLRELDPASHVVWQYRCRADHDFQVLENGNLLINTITETLCPALGPELKRHPYIIEVTRGKERVWE